MTGECRSVRGEWGQPCPDCGATLPQRPGPLASWQSGRAPSARFGNVSDREWSPTERANHMAAHRARQSTVMTDRQREVLRMVEKHGGNRNAAARELGIAPPSVFATLSRLRSRGVEVPA